MFKSTFSKIVVIAFAMVSTAQAQQVYWKSQNIELKFSGTSTVSNFNGVFQKMLSTPVAYECGSNQEPETEVRQGTCYETTCSSSSGKSPSWDAFYAAKKDAKVSKLAAAVKGIGKVSAEKLVAAGYFSSKPRNWEAFKSEIQSAAAQGVIAEQVKTLVLSNYRLENMQNLGYTANSCQSVPYTCNEVIVIREGGYVPQTCVNNVEQVIEQKAMNYTFSVNGATLLPFETESINVTLTGEPSEAKVQSSAYNSYISQVSQNSGNSAVMILQATARKQVALPSDGLQAVTLTPNSASQSTLQILVSPTILPAMATERLVVEYQVRSCQVGFFGTCGIGWDKVQNFSGVITGTVSTFGAPIVLAPGRKGLKMEVEVKVSLQNSIYHSAVPLVKTTNKVTLK